jgi:sugar (pentulose or hexulose) kinase
MNENILALDPGPTNTKALVVSPAERSWRGFAADSYHYPQPAG